MEQLLEKLEKRFGDKFAELKLFDVVYDKQAGECTFCFLYPVTAEEVSSEDRKAITDFIKEFFNLKATIRIKFKRSFLDEPLIKKEVVAFFETYHKALAPYVSEENISSTAKGQDVSITISLNDDVLSLIDESAFKKRLIDYLNKKFIATFSVEFKQSQEKLPEEIEAEDIAPRQGISRYDVRVIRKVFGNDVVPRPEYIKNVQVAKDSVILAGKISNMNKRSFVIKKGKKKGEEKSYYTFNLQDNSGKIECVYFCPKSHEKIMDAMQQNSDMLMFLFVGDVKNGLSDRLTYYIRKMSVCQPVEAAKTTETQQVIDFSSHKRVVSIEPIETLSQDTLFGQVKEYNDTIMNNGIVVFDLETTGLDPEHCEITEIGAVKIQNGKITEKFYSFAKTKSPIPAEVTALTHITNEMLADAPSIDDVIIDFYNYTRGCIISGYNVVDFDMKFIRKASAKLGIKFDNTLLDTLIVARQAGLRVKNYKLGTVVDALGLTLVDAHRAYNDAQATAMVLLELSKLKK